MFGLISERTGDAACYFVTDRTTETLQKHIDAHMNPKITTIHTDGWSAYEGFPWKKWNVKWLKHIHNGGRTFEHSNRIEGLWGQIKSTM